MCVQNRGIAPGMLKRFRTREASWSKMAPKTVGHQSKLRKLRPPKTLWDTFVPSLSKWSLVSCHHAHCSLSNEAFPIK